MNPIIRFSVYEHNLIMQDKQLISRKFIVIKDNENHIIKWTDFHKYIRTNKYKLSRNIADDGNMQFYSVCKLLNYAFFDKYCIKKLNDINIEIVKNFLNDYGMAELPGDKKKRSESTVNTCVRHILDFLEVIIEENPGKCGLKKNELYKKVTVFNSRKKKYEDIKVPSFDIRYSTSSKEIFRDMPESVFSILMNLIIHKHKDILMLAALGAFAGMRPSECCNVRRNDSKLGAGIRFVIVDGEVEEIIIDLTKEYNLRSDLKRVGKIKKGRIQKVYPAFLKAFYECYLIYMDHIDNKKYESDYGALTVNKQGKAITYDNYKKRFEMLINDLIPELFNSNDSEAVNYGYLLQENNIGPHIFRHFFSVMLTLFGEDLSGLMYWRGDTSPESALYYLQNKGDLEKLYAKVNNEIFDYSIWKASKLYKK